MTLKKILVALSLSLCLGFLFSVNSALAADIEYMGVKNCAKCHKKEKVGAQTVKWEKTGHAKAFKELSSDKAMAAAKKVGLAGKPSESTDDRQSIST